MQPERFPRRVLLCVTGLSPQVVTETLYALAVRERPAFVPTEIRLLTTGTGARHAELTLLDPDQGQFHALCADHGLDPAVTRFERSGIRVIAGRDGQPLADIRSVEDNEAAADAITDEVRRLTADPDCAVHASIAGGRKTMGFYLGYALSLFGRPQDRLSHVLVSAPFESHPQFFFPPRRGRVLLVRDQEPVHTREASITLAPIPLVRLRDGLPDSLLTGADSFSDTVRKAQFSLDPPELVLEPARRRVVCAGVEFILPPAEFAFLAWLARRVKAGLPGLCRSSLDPQATAGYLAEYGTLVDQEGEGYERVAQAVGQAMDPDYFDQRRSRLHQHLDRQLGRAGGRAYRVVGSGRRPRTRYALDLKPGQVRFMESADD